MEVSGRGLRLSPFLSFLILGRVYRVYSRISGAFNRNWFDMNPVVTRYELPVVSLLRIVQVAQIISLLEVVQYMTRKTSLRTFFEEKPELFLVRNKRTRDNKSGVPEPIERVAYDLSTRRSRVGTVQIPRNTTSENRSYGRDKVYRGRDK